MFLLADNLQSLFLSNEMDTDFVVFLEGCFSNDKIADESVRHSVVLFSDDNNLQMQGSSVDPVASTSAAVSQPPLSVAYSLPTISTLPVEEEEMPVEPTKSYNLRERKPVSYCSVCCYPSFVLF